MIRKAQYTKSCNSCGAELVCSECGVPSKTGTPFSNWLRDTKIQASCHDIDYVWHNYNENWFMTLEEKTCNASQSISQKDTQGIVFQFLRASTPHQCLTMRGWQSMTYKGHHVIVLENTTPDNGSISLDGVAINKEELLHFLRTGDKHGSPHTNQGTE